MKKVEVFKANDGTLFEDRAECIAYEAKAAIGPMISSFRESTMCPYTSHRHKSMMEKIIPAWEEFKAHSEPIAETDE